MASREPFMVSAPGKVIVFGEHAVVHGKAAIAAATSLRSYLLVTFEPSSLDSAVLEYPDIGFKYSWPLAILSQLASKFPASQDVTVAPKALDPAVVAAVDALIEHVGAEEINEVKRTQFKIATKTFLYLYLSLGIASLTGSTFTMRSTLPIGAGLGSSASLSVCLASAMLYMRGDLALSDDAAATTRMVHLVNEWAFVGEMCLHGNPSGVDNSVATLGKAVLFQRTGGQGSAPNITPLATFPKVRLLMVNTCVSRSTAKEVEKVRILKAEYPIIVDPLLESISQITVAAHTLFDAHAQDRVGDLPGPKLPFLEKLGQLFQMNHGLLVSLGVSHPRLERIRQKTDEHGIGWTKLTGAGGGGCAITLLRDGISELKVVEEELQAEGYELYELELGAPGVGLHKAEKLVSREALLAAKTAADVDSLVGGSASWQYWSGA